MVGRLRNEQVNPCTLLGGRARLVVQPNGKIKVIQDSIYGVIDTNLLDHEIADADVSVNDRHIVGLVNDT